MLFKNKIDPYYFKAWSKQSEKSEVQPGYITQQGDGILSNPAV